MGNSVGGTDYDIARAVGLSAADDVYIAGTFSGGTVDFDPSTSTYNLSTTGYMEDVFIEKFSSTGNFIWAKSFGGYDGERLQAMAVDAFGNIYSTGDFYMEVDFNPGTGVYSLSSHQSGNDIYIQKLDANGNFKWACSFGGEWADLSYDIKIDNQGKIYTYGDFSSPKIDLDPTADSIIFYNKNI